MFRSLLLIHRRTLPDAAAFVGLGTTLLRPLPCRLARPRDTGFFNAVLVPGWLIAEGFSLGRGHKVLERFALFHRHLLIEKVAICRATDAAFPSPASAGVG